MIRGNFIGTNREEADLGNLLEGVHIYGNSENNKVGYGAGASIPLDAPKANTIAFNFTGIEIGDDSTAIALQNSIRGNRIFNNLVIGIDLANNYFTVNDTGDADEGGNRLQNYPDIIQVGYNGGDRNIIAIEYSISSDESLISYPLKVDAYIADDSTSGEGERYIGTHEYTTQDEVVIFEIDADAVTWSSDDVLVLTATDADGNTSEFSPASEEIGGPGSGGAYYAKDKLNPGVKAQSVSSTALSFPYPNPFNPQTTFTLSLEEPAHVRITVHDILGRQVVELSDSYLSSITHTFTFDGAGFASGTYLLRVEAGELVEMRRLLLLK